MDWSDVPDKLRQWHENGCRESARVALRFLEKQFRSMIPGIVRRKWPEDLIESELQERLKKFLEEPLSDNIEKPERYFRKCLQHHFINVYRKQKGNLEMQRFDEGETLKSPPVEHSATFTSSTRSPEASLKELQRARSLHEALQQLSVADRVALKLVSCPLWLDDEEISWLAGRCEKKPDEVIAETKSIDDVYELTRLFDPGEDDPDDGKARRKRMERFRKRRSRARKKLYTMLGGGER